MKRSTIALVAVLALLGLALVYGVSSYNGMVDLEENVNTAWSQVENNYQRRADLIPNLVSTVKGYASHEQKTLEGVIEARSRATSTTIDASQLDEETLRKFQSRQSELSSALSRLLVVAEQYPELKANENFRDLQTQLEGTENRIATARRDFNEVAKTYNAHIRKFPASMVAGIAGFRTRPYFQAEEGSERAPQVDFGS